VIVFPPALKQATEREASTLCHCWIVERRDGQTHGFTDHDCALTIGTVACEPLTGVSGSEVERSLGLSVDAGDIEGAITSDGVSDELLSSGAFDRALVRLHLVDWSAPQNNILLRTSRIARTMKADGVWRADIESAAAELDAVHGRLFTRTCDAVLGDARCGVQTALPQYNAAGGVVSVDGFELVVSGLGAFQAGLFKGGTLTWTSGGNAGRTMPIAAHVRSNGTVRLQFDDALASLIAPGDMFTIRAGCDKSFAACRDTFGNTLNFRGFPHMPGNDHAYAYAREGMDFDGGPVVP
jgi:uncharacterized phage protein (TIGR02218 family)